jgi:hypothetical protein
MAIYKLKLNPISVLELNNILILLVISIIGIITIDPLSLISFVLFLIIASIMGRFFFKGEEQNQIILLFCFYTILTIIIYWFQYIQFPQNGGATGEGIYGGTDDLFFFQEATQKGISYRGDRSTSMLNYSVFLQMFNYVIRLFKVPGQLDLLFVNILAFTFIPIFTRKVARILDFPETSAKLAFYFSAICPIMITNGLVLIRDGWTAMLLISSIYFLLDRRFVLLCLTLLLSFYLRISSGALTLIFIGVLLFFGTSQDMPKYKFKNKIIYAVLVLIAVLVSIPLIIAFLKGNGIYNTFFREGFLGFIQSSSDTNSAATFIYNLPPVLRVIFAPFFYFGSPFLSFNGIIYQSTVTIRSLIVQFYPVLFILYFSLFIQFIGLYVKMDKKKLISLIFLTFIIAIFVLSQLSMQPRHKTMLMPVFYLIIGYGYQNKNKRSLFFALSISFIMFFLELLYNLV